MSDDALSMILTALRRLEDKTDRLQEGQTQIGQQIVVLREDLAVNMARADRVVEMGDNTRAEVRLVVTELSAVWRKGNRLEESVRAIEQGGKSA